MRIFGVKDIGYDVNSFCLTLVDANDEKRSNDIFVNEECVITVVRDESDAHLIVVID